MIFHQEPIQLNIKPKLSNLKVANSSNLEIDKMLHLILRSMRKHHDDLEALITDLESPPDRVCLSENRLYEAEDINCFE